jgi:hypothetical protein
MGRKKVQVVDEAGRRQDRAHAAGLLPVPQAVACATGKCDHADGVHVGVTQTDAMLIQATMSQPVQLSSASNEHYTPADIVERARRLMGAIDLDPASCWEAQRMVKANVFHTMQAIVLADRHPAETVPWLEAARPSMIRGDGLALRPWRGNVFLNPPGGSFKVLNKSFSNAALWWAALVQDWLSGDVKQAVFIGFTLEILRHSQNGCPLPVQAFHRCYPKKRIKFMTEGGVEGKQPSHANLIVYLPPYVGDRSGFCSWVGGTTSSAFIAFRSEFGSLGYCEP